MSWGNGDGAWNAGDHTGNGAENAWGGGGGDAEAAGAGGGNGSGGACRICNEEGHFARECPQKPEGGGLTGECFNCGEVGHNKADCTNPKVDRPFNGTCNLCKEQGHPARECPTNPIVCRLCAEVGHKALECKGRRIINWNGVPELDATEAWEKIIDAAKDKDLDTFRIALKAYARSTMEQFDLVAVEQALRTDNMPIFLIAMKQEIEKNMTIVDLTGLPDREYVLSLQFAAKPRRSKFATGWPADPDENMDRLNSAGYVQDCGVPLCGNCGELGHIRKHCTQEKVEHEVTAPTVECVYCKEEGHRARDCPKERINPFACKNCKKEGHRANECPEPRSAEGVECRKCNQIGHFSRDCPNVEARPPRTCRNCGSEDHIAKECDQPRNPETVTCRNCDRTGHFSRECPEPKDWSKVKCSNCGEMGHTSKRCKAPVNEDGGMRVAIVATGGWDNAGTDAPAAEISGEATWSTGDGAW